MLNTVVLMGRLVADPEQRQTATGKSVAAFRIAVDRGRKDANGQNQADFFSVYAWEHTANFVCRYFQKGSMIALTGHLQSRNYQDKNGQNRTVVEVVADSVSFCGSKNQQAEPSVAPPAYPAARPAPRPAAELPAGYEPIEDDYQDLPF